MRTIGTVVFLVLIGALAADAPAGGDPPAAPPAPPKKDDSKVVTEEEWFAKVKDIQKIDVMGVKKADVLKREASRTAIRVRVKIWDIRPTRDGISIDIMDVMPGTPENERLSREAIAISGEDREAVAGWKKWDRLAFKVKPKVTPDGALEYTRAVTGAADIVRTANPGIEYPPFEQSLARCDTFRDWVDRYTHIRQSVDWKTAWKSYNQACSVAFPMTCTARDGGSGGRGASTRVFDILESTGVTGYGLVDGQGHPLTWVSCQVGDPQVDEALKAGTRAEVHLHVFGLQRREDIEVREGHFQVRATFGRVK